jgi:transposase
VGYNFVTADRDQVFLLPPDVREWLPDDHLAWTVLDAVEQLDLDRFRRRYRADGHGRPAYDPALMVGLLLFAYCDGVRSSRQIEVGCERDVAYRVVAGNQRPDHATIARFRDRHREALSALFVQVLRLCAEAGMVKVGLVAVDGSKMAGNAGSSANRTAEQLEAEVKAMLDQAEATDAAEDAVHGDQRGDEPPPDLRGRQRRLARLRQAKARLDAEAEAAQRAQDERRRAWDAARAKGGKVGGPPGRKPPKAKQGSRRVNLTDPDSQIMKKAQGFCQGYNGQVVTTDGQVIVAADLICTSPDNAALHPMLDQTRHNLDAAGIDDPIRAVVADSGYGGHTNLTTDCDPVLLVSVATGRHRDHNKPFKHPALQTMARRLRHPVGKRLYARRKWMVEPVFGQIKNRLGDRLHHRGHAKATTEWKMIATSHNLLKYWRHLTVQPAT